VIDTCHIEFMVKVTTTALNIELDYKFRSELHILLTDTLFPKIYDTLMHLYKAKVREIFR
jgi:ribosome-associated toxin RatA of RatAB toxin-antitoxin module